MHLWTACVISMTTTSMQDFTDDDDKQWLFKTGAGLALIGGALLLINEQHTHSHIHTALIHEHGHSHKDTSHGHADVEEVRSHEHKHPAEEHEHDHMPDIHHRHGHEE